MTGAYEFVCRESSTDRLCARLNELNGWHWSIGDSHWYGDYVFCKPFPGVRIRIVDFPKRIDDEFKYDADVRLSAECRTSPEEIDQLFRKLLAQVGAHDINEIESFD